MFPEEIVPIEKSKVLVYGASGYAGRLIALECAKRSRSSSAWSAVVAGRTASKIGSVASEVGCESRVFELDRCDRFLSDVGVVVHCAGPFSSTAKPMMDACIRTGTHYLDISGEIEVFQYARSQSKLAAERGSVLCPGAGFDIVPTDCIATRLKEEFPAAREINLAFTFGTLPSVGTLHTVIEGLALGGVIRRDGFLAPVSNGYRIRRIRFQDRSRWCVSIPWADVYTSGISTGVPNGMVLTAMPWIACQMVRATSLVRGMLATKLAEAFMKRLANLLFSGGPSVGNAWKRRASCGGKHWGRMARVFKLGCRGRTFILSLCWRPWGSPSIVCLPLPRAAFIPHLG